ncbi:MAG: LuxR C-terminal-related transcriptional regulator [Gammaproteobacteria bacterium]|nr:LuxR C-terminal-related transcriptional regulator [Gammaproteobacteria bacterium]
MNIILPSKYLSFCQSKDFYDLCVPLFLSTVIDSVIYFQTHLDGGYFHLSTSPEINNYMYIKNKGKHVADFRILDALFKGQTGFKKKCVFIEDIADRNYWVPTYEELGIKSSINIIEKHDKYYDGFWFIARSGKAPYSFFVNHYDVLENFILYFKERARDLIEQGKREKIIWFNNKPEYSEVVQRLEGVVLKDSQNFANLKNRFKLKRYSINKDNLKYYITPREMQCLQYLGQGLSCKEIGNLLYVSSRTVESHLQKIKTRLGVCSRNQLLKVYHANCLASIL